MQVTSICLLCTTTFLTMATEKCSIFLKGTLAGLVRWWQRYIMRNTLTETIQHWNYSSIFITAFLPPTWAKCTGIKAVKHHPPGDTHDGDYSQVTNRPMVPVSAGIHTKTLCKQSRSSWGIIFPMPVAALPCHPLAAGDSLVLSPGTWVALSAPLVQVSAKS